MTNEDRLSLNFKIELKQEEQGKAKWKEVTLDDIKPQRAFGKVVVKTCKELQLNSRQMVVTDTEGYLIHPKKYSRQVKEIVDDFGKEFIMHFKDEYIKNLKAGFMPVGKGASVDRIESYLLEKHSIVDEYDNFEPPV